MNQIPSDATCLSLGLSNIIHCLNCASHKTSIELNPHRKRRSKCHKPWIITAKSTVSKKNAAIQCWNELASNGRISELPIEISAVMDESEINELSLVLRQGQHLPPPESPHHGCSNPLLLGPPPESPRRHGNLLLGPPPEQSPHHCSNHLGPPPELQDGRKQFLRRSAKKIRQRLRRTRKRLLGGKKTSSPVPPPPPPPNSFISPMVQRKSINRQLEFKSPSQPGGIGVESASQSSTKRPALKRNRIFSSRKQGSRCSPRTSPTIQNLDANFDLMSIENNRNTNEQQIQELKTQLNEKDNSIRVLQLQLAELISENEKLKLALSNSKSSVKNLKQRLADLQENDINSCYNSVVNTRVFNKYKRDAECLAKLVKMLKRKKNQTSSMLGRRILRQLVSAHPSVSFQNMSQIFVLTIGYLAAEAGLLGNKLGLADIAQSSPSEKKLRKCLDEATGDIFFNAHYQMFHLDRIDGKVPNIFLSCDKGQNGNLVKVLSWFSCRAKKVEQLILDVDISRGSSAETAEAM